MKNTDDGGNAKLMLAAVQHSGETDLDVDQLILDFARDLREKGYRVGGVAQVNTIPTGACRCDMALEELTSGKVMQISQQLGPGSSGCRLDSSALEHETGLVEASLDEDIDILIINKFGKQEADGMGLRSAIARAAAAGIPVLAGLNPALNDAWDAFCGGEGQILDANPSVLKNWLKTAL